MVAAFKKLSNIKEQRDSNLCIFQKHFHWHYLSCMGPLESLEECIEERASHFAYGIAAKRHSATLPAVAVVVVAAVVALLL